METTVTQASKAATLACLALISAAYLSLPGCSTGENALGTSTGEGEGQIQFTLGGISEGSEENITKAGLAEQTVYVPLDSGMAIACTLAPEPASSTRTTSDMTLGNTYRLIAYDAAGDIAGYADGVAGTTAPQIALPAGTYSVAAYSFNSTTLPTAGTSVSVPAGTDLLYFKTTNVVVNEGASTAVTVTFDHKFNAVKVVADAQALVLTADDASINGIGKTVTAASATLGNSYPATMAVSDGTLTAGTATTTDISWASPSTKNPTSNEAYIYTNSGSSLTLTFTSITFGGGSASLTSTAKSVTFTQAMATNTSYTVTTKFRKLCGAYVSTAGASGSWKEFLCWNLTGYQTVPSTVDPFTPSYLINGAYWQWGNKNYSVGPPTSAAGASASYTWSSTNYNTSSTAWNSGTEAAPVKNSTYDPCPTNYRVPTNTEWTGVVNNNTGASVGTWSSSSNVSNFSAARAIGPSTTVATLLLLGAGDRLNSTGASNGRGVFGRCWSSRIISGGSYHLRIGSGGIATDASLDFRSYGFSVRCIAE